MSKVKNIEGKIPVKEKLGRLNINDILRAPFVDMGAAVQTVRPFNLAERAFCVCMVARAIAKNLSIDDRQIMKYSLDVDLDCMLQGGSSFDARSTRDYQGKSYKRLTSVEREVVDLAGTMVDIHYLNTLGLGGHASDVVTQTIDTLNRRTSLYSAAHPKLSDAVGQVIGEMDLGEFARADE